MVAGVSDRKRGEESEGKREGKEGREYPLG